MESGFDRLSAEFKAGLEALSAEIRGVDARIARLETMEGTLRQVAVTVSGHTQDIGEIKGGLAKLATLEDIAKRTDAFMSDVLASRAERVITDKSFREQRETLIDHELRITRLERREKPS